ncbi:MAG: PAS domain S-box protein [Gemmataceae bacterium]|nr:PAS domain S-box protein [Gemmataceae bacterium]
MPDDPIRLEDAPAPRPFRAPDHEAEARSLQALLGTMAEDPAVLPDRLAEATLPLCRAGAAGVAVAGMDGPRWVAQAGSPRLPAPSDALLEGEGVRPLGGGLAALARAGGKTLGAVWAAPLSPDRPFGAEDARLLAGLAGLLAAALRAEGVRREGESLARALAENLPGGAAFVVDRELRYRMAEGEALLAAGFVPGDLVGKPLAEAVGPELARLYEPLYRQALAGGSFRHEHESHGRRYLSSGTPLRDAGGEVFAVLAVSIDMTARHEAEEALRRSEERFRFMVQAVEDHAIYLMNPAGAVASWNEGAERILGYREEEVLGRPGAMFFTAEDQAAGLPSRELATAVSAGRASDENWLVRKGGARFWASGTTTAVRDGAGRLTGFAKIFRDLTESKAAQERLRESEERLRIALAAGGMGTWLWRIPQDEQVLDESLRALLGMRPEDEVRSLGDFLRFVRDEDRERVRAEFERCRREGGAFDVEFRVGERWLKDQGRAFPGPEGRPAFITGACMDITARREMEQALREAHAGLERRVEERTAELLRAQERAVQSERLAAIGQMAAGFAHESRNALQRGQACHSMLALRLAGRPEELDLVARAQKAQDDLHRLYEDAQGYAAPLVMEHRLCDLRQVWREAWDDLAAARQGREAALREEGDADPRVEGSPFHLRQLFRNLLDNALAAGGTSPEVVLRPVEADLKRRPALRVEVRDNGPGFPPGTAARAFEPFFTTKARGTGLGLAICARIIDAHGGTIVAEEGGPGGRVLVTLPRRKP